jgi:hypothetical protein
VCIGLVRSSLVLLRDVRGLAFEFSVAKMDLDDEIQAVQADRQKKEAQTAMGGEGEFDSDLYTKDKLGDYVNEIAVDDDEADHDEREQNLAKCVLGSFPDLRYVLHNSATHRHRSRMLLLGTDEGTVIMFRKIG